MKKTQAITKEDIHVIVKEIVGEAMQTLREDIISFKDEILKEIIDLRDDVTVVTGYRDMIEEHETRITKLENTAKL